MPNRGLHNFETSTYNQAGLAYDPVSGITVPGSPNPVFVPMRLMQATPPNRKAKPVNTQFVPFIDEPSNLSYGGNTVFEAPMELPKMTLEGSIDTPCVASGDKYLPNILIGSIRITYPEFIAMNFDGRAGNVYTAGWHAVHPRWYRDPYGRVYGDYNNNGSIMRPRVIDFTANYLEGSPVRMNFTMTLLVGT